MPKEFIEKWLILCEGPEDEAFLKQFLRARKIDGFQIEHSKGWQNFGLTLGNFKEVESFIRTVQAVIVLSDCDEGKDRQFRKVCKVIQRDSKFNVPTVPLSKSAATDGQPMVIIVMIPMDGDTGGLEGFIMKAAYSRFRVKTKLEGFINEMPTRNWKRNPQDKARIRVLISTTCKEDPNTPLSWLWSRKPEYHIPLTHKSLDGLAEFLKNFEDFLAEDAEAY
ncbi:MAG: DUF3226 domain-containing protein [Pyrinomonadaceae bacterium]